MKPTNRIRRWLGAAVVLATAAVASSALAVRAPDGDHLTAHPTAQLADGTPLLEMSFQSEAAVPRALAGDFRAFQSDVGSWRALWNVTRGTPAVLFGRGVDVPNAVADGAVAEAFARDYLERHIELLAPGASVDDFALGGNELIEKGRARWVGFEQTHNGMPLVGEPGIGFYFKADRMAQISSSVFPFVAADLPVSRLVPANAVGQAAAFMVSRFDDPQRGASEAQGPFVLPIVTGATMFQPADIEYRTVYRVNVSHEYPTMHWDVYLDANTNEVVASRQTTLFATAAWRLERRRPNGGELQNVVASQTNTSAGTTDSAGNVNANGSVTLETDGPLVRMNNEAGQAIISATATGGDPLVADVTQSNTNTLAVYTTFAYTNFVKEFSRRLNPGLTWLDTKFTANVNINDTCNAFYNGSSINFFQRGGQCDNTGVLADVVMHEFGHGLHDVSRLPGVVFDGPISEAHGDYLAVTIAGRPNLGEGFFINNPSAGLRELDPPVDKVYPDDVCPQSAGPHCTGEILGGTMWDLRKLFVSRYGEAEGPAILDQLWYEALRRSNDMTEMYINLITADDDDGNPQNGSPNGCLIDLAFGDHGLAPDNGGVGSSPSVATPLVEGRNVFVGVTNPPSDAECIVSEATGATIEWNLRGDTATEVIEMTATDGGYTADLPDVAPGSVIEFQVKVELTGGTESVYPTNPADPKYVAYVGFLEEIACFDMSADPGWTLNGFEYGQPTGTPGNGGYTGANVVATNLAGNYTPDLAASASFTVGGLAGRENVRLQYRRFLNVEDSAFDSATIRANGTTVFENPSRGLPGDNNGDNNLHFRDAEWRFADIELSSILAGGDEVTVEFGLTSDAGLQFAGWAVDDVCVLANFEGPVCGDGVVEDGESCDDGNQTDGDGCSATCEDENGGGGCGCRTTDDDAPLGGLIVGLGVLVLVGRRRRQRG